MARQVLLGDARRCSMPRSSRARTVSSAVWCWKTRWFVRCRAATGAGRCAAVGEGRRAPRRSARRRSVTPDHERPLSRPLLRWARRPNRRMRVSRGRRPGRHDGSATRRAWRGPRRCRRGGPKGRCGSRERILSSTCCCSSPSVESDLSRSGRRGWSDVTLVRDDRDVAFFFFFFFSRVLELDVGLSTRRWPRRWSRRCGDRPFHAHRLPVGAPTTIECFGPPVESTAPMVAERLLPTETVRSVPVPRPGWPSPACRIARARSAHQLGALLVLEHQLAVRGRRRGLRRGARGRMPLVRARGAQHGTWARRRRRGRCRMQADRGRPQKKLRP